MQEERSFLGFSLQLHDEISTYNRPASAFACDIFGKRMTWRLDKTEVYQYFAPVDLGVWPDQNSADQEGETSSNTDK
jgi:hypothetical protein